MTKAHNEWVTAHLAEAEFHPDAFGFKEDSEDNYNLGYLDIEASGNAEDDFAARVNALTDPMTASTDPDWDESEHPRDGDGKFTKKLNDLNIAKNVAFLKGDDYGAQQIDQEISALKKSNTASQPKKAAKKSAPVPKLSKGVSKTSAAGAPITAWTKAIYSGKYEDGETAAVHVDGNQRLVWNETKKKYELESRTDGGWKTDALLTKKAAYDRFKNEKKSWLTPSSEEKTADFKPAQSSYVPIAAGDFTALKQVGPNAGTTPGGVFEAPDGSRWYVKGQHSQKHADNEALASAFYRLAGIDVPEVIRGQGTPGLPGTAHTATKMISGASQTLPKKLGNDAYISKIKEGFALDAWLANWDVVGEGDENPWGNIVEGEDGKPHRIDVGGALLFRGLGSEKGNLFGNNVTEFDRMRDTSTGSRHTQIFAGMTDGEIVSSVERVEKISPTTIRDLVVVYDLDPSLADTLIARRENLLALAAPFKKNAPTPAPPKISDNTAPGELTATNVMSTSGNLMTKPWSDKPMQPYIASLTVHVGGEHIGALHQNEDGTWNIFGAGGRSKFVQKSQSDSLDSALEVLADADNGYVKFQLKKAAPKAVVAEKKPKLTATQIEKQNGAVPKTLKKPQKAAFMANFKNRSSAGFVASNETDMKRVMIALVDAVNLHNATESPKLNFLQGINLADEENTKLKKHEVNQKLNLIGWLKSAEGKALAPMIINGTLPPETTGLQLDAVPSPYMIGTPKKIEKKDLPLLSLFEAIEMHEEMTSKSPLTDEQIQMVESYTGADSGDFNYPLRQSKKFDEDEAWRVAQIRTLQLAMRPTTRSFKVIRTTGGLGPVINNENVTNFGELQRYQGAVVRDPQFLSTSIAKGVFDGGNFTLMIDVPEGTPGIFAHMYSEQANEREFLLAAGLQYRIDRVEMEPRKASTPTWAVNNYILHMTVIPEVAQ